MAHLPEEPMRECLKSKVLELRQHLRADACELVAAPRPPIVVGPLSLSSSSSSSSPVSSSSSLSQDGDAVALSAEEQEFVRRLLRISAMPLTRNQLEALDAVRQGNSELFARLEGKKTQNKNWHTFLTSHKGEVAAETGEYRLQHEIPEGFAGSSGLAGHGLPAWDRKLAVRRLFFFFCFVVSRFADKDESARERRDFHRAGVVSRSAVSAVAGGGLCARLAAGPRLCRRRAAEPPLRSGLLSRVLSPRRLRLSTRPGVASFLFSVSLLFTFFFLKGARGAHERHGGARRDAGALARLHSVVGRKMVLAGKPDHKKKESLTCSFVFSGGRAFRVQLRVGRDADCERGAHQRRARRALASSSGHGHLAWSRIRQSLFFPNSVLTNVQERT